MSGRSGPVRRGAWPLALAAVLLTGCTAAAPTSPGDNELQRQLVADVTVGGTEPHLQELQRIADRNGGNRASPGPGYDASVDYVAGVLRDAGYDVTTPTFTVGAQGSGGGRRDGRRGDGEERPVTVRNVIAQTRTGNVERVVMAGAHLDSVPEGPGINDNGTGVAALLEIAVRLGGAPAVTNAVRFGFWGSEEVDLNGSTSYVRSLPAGSRPLLYLNLDMLGSPNAGYFLQGGVGEEESETGPPGSADVARVVAEQLASVGITAEATTFDEASDYAAFVDAGIPSAGILTGDEDEMTPAEARQWNGRPGTVFDSCYHSACDRIENVNTTALDRFADATAGTVAHFAVSTDALPN